MRAQRGFIVKRKPEFFISVVQGIRTRTPDQVLQNYLERVRVFSLVSQILELVYSHLFLSTARSAGALAATPLGGIWQREQVQTGEKLQGEREHRQETHTRGVLSPYHGDDVDDDG